MGEYADMAIEAEMNAMFDEPFDESQIFRPKIKQKIKLKWKDKEGKVWDVKDMTTSHIENSLAKCERDNWNTNAIPYFKRELKKRNKE